MKKGITTIALLILMSVSFNSYSREEHQPTINTIDFYNGMAEVDTDTNNHSEFYVSYFLDTDGKPYIISIKSKDQNMTEMVRKMINLPIDQYPIKEGNWYSITFLYENIQ
ncbi:MAG: hypothetical protein R2753_11045 [Chitinophagales bacterium]